MSDKLSIPGYSKIEYKTYAGNTIVTQSNYPFSNGIEVSIRGWHDESIMKYCSHLVAAWHVKGTKQFNNPLHETKAKYKIGQSVLCNGVIDTIVEFIYDDPDGYDVVLKDNGTQSVYCINPI